MVEPLTKGPFSATPENALDMGFVGIESLVPGVLELEISTALDAGDDVPESDELPDELPDGFSEAEESVFFPEEDDFFESPDCGGSSSTGTHSPSSQINSMPSSSTNLTFPSLEALHFPKSSRVPVSLEALLSCSSAFSEGPLEELPHALKTTATNAAIKKRSEILVFMGLSFRKPYILNDRKKNKRVAIFFRTNGRFPFLRDKNC